MANDIGSVKGVTGSSTALNGQKGAGGHKPMASGNSNPGNTKPPYEHCPTAPITK